MDRDECQMSWEDIIRENIDDTPADQVSQPPRKSPKRRRQQQAAKVADVPVTASISTQTFAARYTPFIDDVRARIYGVLRRGTVFGAYRIRIHLSGFCDRAFDAAFASLPDITDRSKGQWRSTLECALAGKGKYERVVCAYFDNNDLRDWCSFHRIDPSHGHGASALLTTSRKVLIELHCSLRVNMQRKVGNQFHVGCHSTVVHSMRQGGAVSITQANHPRRAPSALWTPTAFIISVQRPSD